MDYELIEKIILKKNQIKNKKQKINVKMQHVNTKKPLARNEILIQTKN